MDDHASVRAHSALIDVDPGTGHPRQAWALVLALTDDPDALDAVDGWDPVVNHADLDRPLAALPPTARQRLGAVAARRGLGNPSTGREAVRGLGRKLQPAFDEGHMGVG